MLDFILLGRKYRIKNGKVYDIVLRMNPTGNPPIFDAHKTLIANSQVKPKYELFGYSLFSNFGMAACPGAANSHYIRAAFTSGFVILTMKTQRSVAYPANVFPNVLQLEINEPLTPQRATQPITGRLPYDINLSNFSIANSCGNNSDGPGDWVPDARQAIQAVTPGQLLILSVVGTIQEGFSEDDYYADFARTAQLAAEAGAKVIELNLSCPNVVSEGIVCHNEHAVVEICKRTKEVVGDVPIVIKIAFFSYNQEELLRRILQATRPYISAIAAINTMGAPIVDENGNPAFPGPGREKAGVSGSAIKWAGIDMVNRLAHIRDALGLGYKIIGIGGVMGPQDYHDYVRAGADAIQSASAAMWNPDLAAQVKQSLHTPYIKS
jgi:dihydroorotate dehydrogenase